MSTFLNMFRGDREVILRVALHSAEDESGNSLTECFDFVASCTDSAVDRGMFVFEALEHISKGGSVLDACGRKLVRFLDREWEELSVHILPSRGYN